MSNTTWNLAIATERLILRPQQSSDYEAWYAGFAGRLPSQHKYDEGQVDLNECDFQWFANLCQHHQKLALHLTISRISYTHSVGWSSQMDSYPFHSGWSTHGPAWPLKGPSVSGTFAEL